jgi:sugar lactone lactonase YvrE
MSRVATEHLHAALYDDAAADALSGLVEPFALTPATGGTAIDADGVVYVGDTDRQAVWRVHPNGTSSLLVHDPRLLCVDAMWVDSNNTLWMPAAQLNRGDIFLQPGNVSNTISWPMQVFTMNVGTGPSAIDHA